MKYIAQELNVRPITIKKKLLEYGIKIRRNARAVLKDYKKESFSFGYMLGICTGDGYMHDQGINIVSHFPDLGIAAAKHWKEWTGLDAGLNRTYQRIKQAPYQKEPTLYTEYRTSCNSVIIARFLKSLNFGKKKSTIPNIVMTSKNKKFIYGFLSGFFDSEGSPSYYKPKGYNQINRRIRCYFANEQIKNQVKQLLVAEGITVGEYYRDSRNTWELYFCNHKDILFFAKQIGFQVSYKKQKLEKLWRK